MVTSEGGQRLPVRTDFTCDPVTVDPDRLAPIALFSVEAISNARKHGLEAGGQLSVVFKVHGDTAELSITDTGHAGQSAKLGTGVGHTLMTAFARQLRGEASFQANAGGGLTAKLEFPLPEKPPEPKKAPTLSPLAAR